MGQVQKINVGHELELRDRHRLASREDQSVQVQVMDKVTIGFLLFLNLNHNTRVC